MRHLIFHTFGKIILGHFVYLCKVHRINRVIVCTILSSIFLTALLILQIRLFTFLCCGSISTLLILTCTLESTF